jgi:hypothetical protein
LRGDHRRMLTVIATALSAVRIGARLYSPMTRGADMTVCRRPVTSWKPQGVGFSGLDRVGTRKTGVKVPASACQSAFALLRVCG